MLSVTYQNRKILDEIAQILQVDFANYLQNQQPYLTTAQILELKENNFYIGAHSVDHPDFHQITDEQKLWQVKESLKFVQQQFNVDYRIFSFPFFDHAIKASFFNQLNDLGIQLSFGISGLKMDEIPTNFQRIPMEKSSASAKKIVTKKYFTYLLKRLFGKHILKRN